MGFVFYFLLCVCVATLRGTWDPSSPTRDRTCGPCSGSLSQGRPPGKSWSSEDLGFLPGLAKSPREEAFWGYLKSPSMSPSRIYGLWLSLACLRVYVSVYPAVPALFPEFSKGWHGQLGGSWEDKTPKLGFQREEGVGRAGRLGAPMGCSLPPYTFTGGPAVGPALSQGRRRAEGTEARGTPHKSDDDK